MKPSTKTKLFYIFTLGIGYLYVKNKAKNISSKTNNKIEVSKVIDFDIKKLISALGGKSNILEINSTISNLKVKVNSIESVDVNGIKNLGAVGTLKNMDIITILFGDNSPYIAELLKKNIK